MEELSMLANMKIQIQKFPFKLREKWRINTNKILERTDQRACLLDIGNFIEHQIRIIPDPVFGDIQDLQLQRES